MRFLWITSLVLAAGIGTALAGELPVPPIPVPPIPVPPIPSHDTQGIRAPVPDTRVEAPQLTDQSGPKVAVRFYSSQYHDSSEGFTPGSRYRMITTHTLLQPPGLSVSVPIQ